MNNTQTTCCVNDNNPNGPCVALQPGAPLVAAVRARPEVADAQAGEIVLARAKVGEDWIPLLLFVAEDYQDLRINTFRTRGLRLQRVPD